MAFIPSNLLVETPLISLFDDDSNCPPLIYTTLSPQILNSGSVRSRVPRAPTPDLIDLTEHSSEGKLYDEIYQKNLLKFLATGGFAARKTAAELSANAPIIHSIIDEPISTNGYSNSLTHQQEFIAEGIPTDVVDYDGGSSTEFEFEPREVEDELLVCFSDETVQPPFKNSKRGDSVRRRPSLVGEFVNLPDEITEPNILISQENFDKSCQGGEMGNYEKFMLLFDEAEQPHSDSEVEEEEEQGDDDGGGNGDDGDDDDDDQEEEEEEEDYARNSQDKIGPRLVQSSDAERSAGSEDCASLFDLTTSGYLASESSLSQEELNSNGGSPSMACPPSPTHLPDTQATTRRLVRINLPNQALCKMHQDPRFIGFCHAWIRRPDLCRRGVNCSFSHAYPPALAREYGMIAVYVKPNGKEVKDVAEFLSLEEAFVKTQCRLDEGVNSQSAGGYKGQCRAFLRNECPHGDQCRFKHPKSAVERGKLVPEDLRKFASGKHRTYCRPDGRGGVDTGYGSWRKGQYNSPAVFPRPSPTVVHPTNSGRAKDYNYWGEEIAGPDSADYWAKSPPAMISRPASREQAYAAEAMTCKQPFRGESRREVLEDFYRPHATPRAASGFPMRAESAGTRRGAGWRKISEKEYSLPHVEQEKEVGQNMINFPDMRIERVKNEDGPSRVRQNRTRGTELNNDSYDTADSDWIKSLKEMLAQKCEPTMLKAEGELGALMDFD